MYIPSSVCEEGLKAMTSQRQGVILHPDLSFQAPLSIKRSQSSLPNSRNEAGKAAGEPESLTMMDRLKMDGDKAKGQSKSATTLVSR